MRPHPMLLAVLLLPAMLVTAGCHPILPPESLAYFAPERHALSQRVAGALQQDAASDNMFVLLFPELRTAAAPRWLRPATRVTYSFASATFARVPDDRTPSGAGLVQYDVIAQNRRNVVLLSSLVNTQIAGQLPTPLSFQVSLPGAGEFWLAPRALEGAEAVASESLAVARMPLTVEGTTYNVVRMQSNTITDHGSGEEVWAFDTATGLLVFYRQALYWPDGAQRSGITMTLLGRRQLRVPWRGGSVPDWVKRGLTWHFAGSQTVDVGVPPGTSLPMTAQSRITRVGALWSEHTLQTYLYGQDAGSSVTASGAMQLFGGYWLPPEALAVLKTGMILDEDPLSGITVSVVQANRQQIVVAASGSGHVTQLYYDARDGRLAGIYLEQHTPASNIYTNLGAQ